MSQMARSPSQYSEDRGVKKLVSANIEERQLGILGRARLNVLLLNLALDEKFK